MDTAFNTADISDLADVATHIARDIRDPSPYGATKEENQTYTLAVRALAFRLYNEQKPKAAKKKVRRQARTGYFLRNDVSETELN